MHIEFLFPTDLTPQHREVIFRYLEDSARLSAQDWVLVITAFNLLKRAVLVQNVETTFTFARIYRQVVENRYAEPYIAALYEMHDLNAESNTMWASSARQIPNDLSKARLYNPSQKGMPLRWKFFGIYPQVDLECNFMICASARRVFPPTT